MQIETDLALNAHRISAHRALTLNPSVAKIGEQAALAGLRTGNTNHSVNVGYRIGSQWHSNVATALLNDFDFLIQALFADQANKSLETHQKIRAGGSGPADPTRLERFVEIWERLLPHRHLHITGDDIQVPCVQGSLTTYKASEMNDGERAIFYMVGQTLVAAENSLLIFDEPELHVHRSIMGRLWDELEAPAGLRVRLYHSRPGICCLSRGKEVCPPRLRPCASLDHRSGPRKHRIRRGAHNAYPRQ